MEETTSSERSAWLAGKFEENRGRLRGVAYRMLGSLTEADDAVQEVWLRLSRSDSKAIENLTGWLTTVVARVCLDILRSRQRHREEALETQVSEPTGPVEKRSDPEQEAVLADSVGVALLVVLDKLTPPERIAFVLHDLFGLSFEDIATTIDKSPEAARQLASRARRRVRGAESAGDVDLIGRRRVVSRFLDALRSGDVEKIVAVLDPQVVVHIDEGAGRPGAPRMIQGARNWAKGAVAFTHLAAEVQLANIDGTVGLIWAPGGHLRRALALKIENDKIVDVVIVADPKRLRDLNISVLEG